MVLVHSIYMILIPIIVSWIWYRHSDSKKRINYLSNLMLLIFLSNYISYMISFFTSTLQTSRIDFNILFFIYQIFVVIGIQILLSKLPLNKITVSGNKTLLSLAIAIFSISTVYTIWFTRNVGNIGVERMLFNIISPVVTNNDSFKNELLPLIVLMLILAISGTAIVFMKKRKNSNVRKKLMNIISVVVIILGILITYLRVDAKDLYTYLVDNSNYIEENYVDANAVTIDIPSKKRNLVFIMVESLEASYHSKSNGGFLDKELLPNISQHKNDTQTISFSNTEKQGGYLPISGTAWSVAGVLAQTSGIPYRVSLEHQILNKNKGFLPKVKNLGDILNEQGYNQHFIVGSDGGYGKLDDYFGRSNHKIHDINSLKKENKVPQDYHEWWGIEDRTLFELSKEILNEETNDKQPFSIFIELNDTHYPRGYQDKKCNFKENKDYANSILCVDEMVSDFVKWIQEQDYYKDTTIVIMGDHLSMDTDFFKRVPKNYERTGFNMFINISDGIDIKSVQNKNRQFASFDIFPTILSAMGMRIEGSKLGLGTDLFSNEQTLIEKDGFKKVNNELKHFSNFYEYTFME